MPELFTYRGWDVVAGWIGGFCFAWLLSKRRLLRRLPHRGAQ